MSCLHRQVSDQRFTCLNIKAARFRGKVNYIIMNSQVGRRLGMRGGRSGKMLRLIGIEPPETAVQERTNLTQNRKRGTTRKEDDDSDSDTSSFTESECGVLNTQWLRDIRESNKVTPPSKRKIVDYSSSPALQSGDKENEVPSHKVQVSLRPQNLNKMFESTEAAQTTRPTKRPLNNDFDDKDKHVLGELSSDRVSTSFQHQARKENEKPVELISRKRSVDGGMADCGPSSSQFDVPRKKNPKAMLEEPATPQGSTLSSLEEREKDKEQQNSSIKTRSSAVNGEVANVQNKLMSCEEQQIRKGAENKISLSKFGRQTELPPLHSLVTPSSTAASSSENRRNSFPKASSHIGMQSVLVSKRRISFPEVSSHRERSSTARQLIKDSGANSESVESNEAYLKRAQTGQPHEGSCVVEEGTDKIVCSSSDSDCSEKSNCIPKKTAEHEKQPLNASEEKHNAEKREQSPKIQPFLGAGEKLTDHDKVVRSVDQDGNDVKESVGVEQEPGNVGQDSHEEPKWWDKTLSGGTVSTSFQHQARKESEKQAEWISGKKSVDGGMAHCGPSSSQSDVPSKNKPNAMLEEPSTPQGSTLSSLEPKKTDKEQQSSSNETSNSAANGEAANEQNNLTPYQKQRMMNLRENESFLKALGVQPELSPSISLTTPSPKAPSSREKQRCFSAKSSSQRGKFLPVRESSKTARQLIRNSVDHSDSEDSDIRCLEWSQDGLQDEDNFVQEDETDSSELSSSDSDSREDTPCTQKKTAEQKKQLYASKGHHSRQRVASPQAHEFPNAEEEAVDDVEVVQSGEENGTDVEEVARDGGLGGHEEPERRKKKTAELKKERQALRNSGQQYVRSSGEVVRGRVRKPPHECKRNKCHLTITPEVGERLFEEYWAQGTYNKRLSYVVARIQTNEVARKRPRQEDSSREKSHSYKYFFDINGTKVQVCRSTFLDTIGETDRFVRDAAANKNRSYSGISRDDSRGRHKPKHALPETAREAVIRHIESFPAYVSHYCRNQTNLLYLSPELNRRKMHDLYKEIEGNPPVSYDTYRKIFRTTKRKFHAPKTDGCDTCDKLEVLIAAAQNDEDKAKHKNEKELHLRKAEKGYELKRLAREAAMKDPTKRVIVFDLQQCLPTPHLKCKEIYYARQLYVYNFTVNDPVTGLTHCYMWTEAESERGSNEIATCLLKHILEQIPNGVTSLKLFSDCCGGQNRNSTIVMAMFVALQEHPSLQVIDHHFLQPGHTFMSEVDNKHSVIERYKKTLLKVSVPSEWFEVVRQAGMTDKTHFPEGKFKVVHVKPHYDISSLAKGPLVKRDICTDKQKADYLGARWMQYRKEQIGCVLMKNSMTEEAPFKTLSFLRRGRNSLPQLLPLIPQKPGAKHISVDKKKNLLSLLSYLNEEHHEFYHQLTTDGTIVDTHPDERPPPQHLQEED